MGVVVAVVGVRAFAVLGSVVGGLGLFGLGVSGSGRLLTLLLYVGLGGGLSVGVGCLGGLVVGGLLGFGGFGVGVLVGGSFDCGMLL